MAYSTEAYSSSDILYIGGIHQEILRMYTSNTDCKCQQTFSNRRHSVHCHMVQYSALEAFLQQTCHVRTCARGTLHVMLPHTTLLHRKNAVQAFIFYLFFIIEWDLNLVL